MRSIIALIRVTWLTHTSYRLNVVMSLLGLVAMFVPIYLVSGALQPVVAESIADEGEVYFGFLLTGMAVVLVMGSSMQSLPDSVSSGIHSGTLEALFATPTGLNRLLVGMIGYDMIWAILKFTLLLAAFWLVGGEVHLSGIPVAIGVLALIILAHLPLGIFAASMILLFRTSGPLIPGLLGAFSLLGGVYYSTTVIPDVLRPLAQVVPLTYGLRAFRRTLLSGEPLSTVAADVLILGGFAGALLVGSILTLRWSFNRARHAGSLAQY